MRATLSQFGRQLLLIKSDEPNINRKGRLLQLLLGITVFISCSHILARLVTQFAQNQPVNYTVYLLSGGATFLLAVACWRFIRIGRLRIASHILCGGLALVFLTLLAFMPNAPVALAYLTLIPIVAIAVLQTIVVSALYAAVTTTAVFTIFWLTPTFYLGEAFLYLLTVIGVSVTVWSTSRDLRTAIAAANNLAEDIRAKNNLLQHRAHQLQLGAEIGQRTSDSLELDKLLQTAVVQIRDRFGFYHVSIFLSDNRTNTLHLREATGPLGQRLKKENYTLPIDENAIVGWVALHQEPRISPDIQQDPNFLVDPLLPDTKAELCIPLIARGELRGVLDVQSRTVNAFQEEDVSILQIVANQVAINIDNAQLFAQTQSRLNETKTLYDLNTLLTTTLDVGEIYRRASREFATKLNVTRCAIASWEKEDNTVTMQAEFVHNPANKVIDEYVTTYQTYDLTHYPAFAHVLESHQPSLDTLDDPALPRTTQESLAALEQQACLKLPLVYGVEALGIVTLYRDKYKPPFDPGEIQLAQTMANQTAVALNNAILTSNTRGQLAQFSSLHRLSNILSQAPSLQAVFDGARREILGLVEATGMSISLLTEDGNELDWIYGYEYGQKVDLSEIPPLPITEGFSGHVARTRDVFYVQKAQELRDEFDSVTVGADLGYWLGLPMIVANKLIGVLAVENDTAFTDRDIDLLKTIVGPVSIAINNLIQFEEVQQALEIQSRQRIQLKTAAEVAAAATSVLALGELMQNAVNLIKERFALYYVGLFLVDADGREAVLKAGTGQAGKAQLAEKRALTVGGKSLIGGATADGEPRITQDVTKDEEWLPNPHLPQTRSELALPLRVRNRVIGALTVQSSEPDVFDVDLISTLQTMSDQLAVAIENAQLLSAAETKARDQARLHQISTQFHQSADVKQIVSVGLKAISARLGGADVELVLGTGSDTTDDKEEKHTSNSKAQT